MRNPSRTLHNSIFEPLYSHQEELHFQLIQPAQASSSDGLSQNLSSLFSLAPPSPKPSCIMQRALPTTPFNDSMSPSSDEMAKRECELEPAACDHAVLGMHSPSGSSTIISPSSPSYSPPCRSRSSSDVLGGDHDDGSVASKLLASITKSISSPSLLACCKEAARETPYQKTLRLRKMKLQHCAEELGSESCDGSPCDGDDINSIFDSFKRMSSSQSTRDFSKAHQESEGNASPMIISVRSSPNLGCASLVSKHSSQIKERSFPPPLSHTLPRSASSDSFSYSLRAFREDGRFVLKEVKVPCRQYFQASRKDGRFTLHRLMTDEDSESKLNDEANKECKDLQEDGNNGECDAVTNIASDKSIGGLHSKVEVESAEAANLVGELEVCGVKESKKSDHVGMDNSMEEREGVECLYAALSSGNCGSAKNDKANCIPQVGASRTIESDFKAAKRKACHVRSSNRHLLSSWPRQQPPIHPPAKSPRLRVGHFDVAKFTQCAGSLGLESKSARGVSIVGGKTLQSFQIMSASLHKLGYGVGKGASSTTIIFKDVSAESLMENVTKLVASCRLDGGKLPCEEESVKSRELERRSCNSGGIMESSMWKGIKSVGIGARETEDSPRKSMSGLSVDVGCEHGASCCAGACQEGGCAVAVERSCLPSSSCQFDVKATSTTSSQAALQGKEWLHTLHCKELFHIRSLGKGAFMKLHCVA